MDSDPAMTRITRAAHGDTPYFDLDVDISS